MCKDAKTPAMDIGEVSARNLRRIADALGLQPSEFYGPTFLDVEGLTLLTLVQAYLIRSDPNARVYFKQAVQAMDVPSPTV